MLKTMADTVGRCVSQLAQKFAKSNVPEAKTSAELIVASVIGHKTLHGVWQGLTLSSQQLAHITRLAEKRVQRMPVQYVIGDWDFRSLTLVVRPPVFIPRQTTEELVGYALEDQTIKKARRGIEIGCGSGAISLSLLQENYKLQMTAVDQGAAACELTLENAKRLGLMDRLRVEQLDVKADSFKALKFGGDNYDFLISNPPYVTTRDMETLEPEISQYEDQAALHGGYEGFNVISTILQVVPHIVKANGSIWLEVDSFHPPMIARYVKEQSLPIQGVAVLPDYEQISRFCHLKHVRKMAAKLHLPHKSLA